MEIPPVRYLETDRGDIAYQRFGEGDRTIVWTGMVLASIETRWDHPGNIRLWEFLSSLGQVVTFDYRGFGVSEQLSFDRIGQLDELAFDLAAVVEHLAGPPTVIVATGATAMTVAHYMASRPDNVDRLVLLNPLASDPLRDALDPEERIAEVRRRWGTGETLERGVTRGRAIAEDDPGRRTAARTERVSATPAVVEAWMRTLLEHDVTDLLAKIAVPTLVVHTDASPRITPAMSERVADCIPGADYVTRPSDLFNWGEWDSDIKAFVTGEVTESEPYRDLVALLFTDVVASTEHALRAGDAKWVDLLACLDDLVEQAAATRQGRVVKQTGDGHLVEFARPGDAISAARDLTARARGLGLEIRSGVHFAEVERRSTGDLGGLGVHIAARISAVAGPGEILVPRSVTELTAGSRHTYVERGTYELKGVPGTWQLYSLTTE